MKIGYCRTSTTHQKYSLEYQSEVLRNAGCERIFSEEISALAVKRPEFENAIEFAREGDVFCVSSLSRFGRSLKNILDVVQILKDKGVSFEVLDMSVETSTPTGELVFNMIASIYQFERDIMLERQKIGLEKSRKEGRIGGRPKTAESKSAEIVRLHKEGKKPSEIARELDIGVASVYRYRNG